MDREHIEPIVKIAAEFTIDNHLFEIAVGGGDQPYIGLNQFIAAQTFEFLLLENAQQLRLQFQRHIADLIEEQRAFVRQFETADALGAGAGKSAALVAEQIAFQQARRHCRAVHFHHPSAVAPAQVMNSAGNQFFTGAGFTEDQHRTVALRHHLHLFKHAVHRFAATDDFAELAFDVVELFGERQVFIHQPFFQPLDLAIGEGVIDSYRHALGDLPQQFKVGSGKHLFIALRQLQHSEQRIAGHER